MNEHRPLHRGVKASLATTVLLYVRIAATYLLYSSKIKSVHIQVQLVEQKRTLVKTRNQFENDVLHHTVGFEVKKRLRLVYFQATLRTALATLKVFDHTTFADYSAHNTRNTLQDLHSCKSIEICIHIVYDTKLHLEAALSCVVNGHITSKHEHIIFAHRKTAYKHYTLQKSWLHLKKLCTFLLKGCKHTERVLRIITYWHIMLTGFSRNTKCQWMSITEQRTRMKAFSNCCGINEVASTQRTHDMCINVANTYLQYLKHRQQCLAKPIHDTH